jgi:hypothetical protein
VALWGALKAYPRERILEGWTVHGLSVIIKSLRGNGAGSAKGWQLVKRIRNLRKDWEGDDQACSQGSQ